MIKLSDSTRTYIIIAATFAVAFVLAVLPFPTWAEKFRPDWVGLVLIYWCIATPNKTAVGVGWVVGLFQDVLYDSPLLGQYALAKAILAFIAIKLHLRMRMYPRWQQAVVVLLLLTINQLIVVWTRNVLSQPAEFMAFWTSGLFSMLIWPWLFVVLRDIRRRIG